MKIFENEALWCSLMTVGKGRLAHSLRPCPYRSSMRCFHKWRAWSIFPITFFFHGWSCVLVKSNFSSLCYLVCQGTNSFVISQIDTYEKSFWRKELKKRSMQVLVIQLGNYFILTLFILIWPLCHTNFHWNYTVQYILVY